MTQRAHRAPTEEAAPRRPRRPAGHREATGGQLLTILATGIELACGKDVVYKLIASGELTSIKVGGSRRVLSSSVESFIARKVAESATV